MDVFLNLSTILLAAVCISGAIGYVIATWKAVRSAAAAAKIAASTSFVILALANGALATTYGRAILIALILCWIGDVLLLSRQSPFFLTGIGAFLAAHVVFSLAFALKPFNTAALTIALAVAGIVAALILSWLWKHLSPPYTAAVPLYLLAVMIMVSLAAAATAVSLPAVVTVGSLAFAVSDISVARDRFIERTVLNKAWGLPLYYFAQVLFAVSVAGVG